MKESEDAELSRRGFDGLFHPDPLMECGCFVGDLRPCGETDTPCRGGHASPDGAGVYGPTIEIRRVARGEYLRLKPAFDVWEIDTSPHPTDVYFAAYVDRRIAGGASYRALARPGVYRVKTLLVLDPYRKEGIGRALLAAVMDDLRRLGAIEANAYASTHAVRPNEEHGFETVSVAYKGPRRVPVTYMRWTPALDRRPSIPTYMPTEEAR